MFKKVLKVLWWVSKWYLKLTVLYWAFIGMAEAALRARKYNSLLAFTKEHNMKKARKKIFYMLESIILNTAIWKWKYGLGLTDKEPGEIPEPKKSEEKTEESEA